MNAKLPRLLGTYRGRKVYRFSVIITQSDVTWCHHLLVPVVSHTAIDAVRLVQDESAPSLNHPAEFEARGPKGGIVHRFTGYEGLIWAKICNVGQHQLTLL